MLLNNESHIIQLLTLIQEVMHHLLIFEDAVVYIRRLSGYMEDMGEVIQPGNIGKGMVESILDEPLNGGGGSELLLGL